MKKIIYRITSIAVLFMAIFIVGCEEQLTVFEGPYHVRFTTTASTIDENKPDGGTINLHFAGTKPSSPIDVTLSVEGGQEGVDFIFLEGGTSLTIPAGDFFTSFKVAAVNNDVNDGNKVITFTIESVSGGFDAGFGLVGKTYTLTIKDDDCATPNLEGTYLVYNRNASPAACGNPANDADLTYESTITFISEVGDVRTYEISDVTGGLYALCYGDGENPGQITTNRFTITLTSQPDVVYGGDEFNGSGLIECNGNFTLTWSNGFGDKATSYYTRKN
jgi:hypothetical protein